ncbi:hypothetical protein [Campylobacter concisus]|uniref:hypothetical protein n=1 Tax=Campylobacter concisus TaxID=199 RepID=UPI0021CC6E5F|nr:hypothetical protein [Campylobacter concisus]
MAHRYTSDILVTAVLIVIRLMASYGAVYITMFMKRFISVADDRNPGKATPFIVGWAGMRGVVSLAAALSIPAMAGGRAISAQRPHLVYHLCRDIANACGSRLKLATAHQKCEISRL